MKRRISKTTHKDPSPIGPLLQPGHPGFRSSDFLNPNPQGTKDMSFRKRVKFSDLDVDIPLSCRRNASSTPLEGRRGPRSDDPKTSEFAFFKKLKENAVNKFQSHTLHKEENQSKKFKISDCSGEKTNSVKNSCKDFSSALLAENVIPINCSSLLSPLGSASKNSEVNPLEACTTSAGAQHRHGEIFSRKRQKLRQWVAKTSYPQIEELCSKGYDFVSLLLSRLCPENNDNNGFKNSKSREVDIDTKSQFLASLETDIQLKKLSHIPARKYMEIDYGSHLDGGPSPCWLNRSPEVVLSNSYSPPSDMAHLKYEIREPGYKVGRRTPILCTESDSTYGFQSKRYGSLAYNRLKELDELHDPNKYLIQREPHTLLLGWDFDRITEERNLPGHEVGGRTPVQCTESDSAYGFQSKRYGSLDYNCLKELDELHDPNKYLIQREPHTPLLGWDFDRFTEERNLRGHEVGGRTPVLCTESDSAYGFQSKRYGSLDYNCLKELDELHDPNKYLIQREPHTLLLGWDFDRSMEERNLSITCQSTELSVYSPSSSSWGDDHQHILDDRFGAKELSESSLLSIYSPNVISLPWSRSASYNDLDFGKQVEGEEDVNADSNHFPLALTLAPDYLTPAENCKNDTKCKDSSLLLSPQNLQIMSKVFSERYHNPGVEGFLLSSGLDIDLEWNCPSLSGSSWKHHSPFDYALQPLQNEGTSACFLLKDKNECCLDGSSHRRTLSHVSDVVNIQDLSSFNFQVPMDKDKSCPLLLDKSNWDGT